MQGIDISLFKSNIFHWRISLDGLKHTPWENSIFIIDFIFNHEFNCIPPQINFITIPFHPNIDLKTGRPCLDALDNWNSNISLLELIISIQTLISNPQVDESTVINNLAADLYVNSSRAYNQMIQDSIISSRRIHDGVLPFEDAITINEETSTHKTSFKNNINSKQEIHFLSFENYHDSWSSLATANTKPRHKIKTYLEIIKSDLDAKLNTDANVNVNVNQDVDVALKQSKKNLSIQQQVLIKGRFKQTLVKIKNQNIKRNARINAWKAMYKLPSNNQLKKDLSSNLNRIIETENVVENEKLEKVETNALLDGDLKEILSSEKWIQEADDLVQWTSELRPFT